jgi:hypothetical protein
MFVNDTSRLPDSGRVCIASFNSGQAANTTFYSLVIHSAHADIEPMVEPKNPFYVLGVGTKIESVNGPVFAAYFAASRERFDAEPNYRSGLYVLVGGSVYAVKEERIGTTIRRGFSTREFTLLRGDRPQRKVEYSWPFYKEPFVSAKPGHARSLDFLREMSAMVHTYG